MEQIPLELLVERQIFKLAGATIRTYDTNHTLICKAEQKAFKLKEDIPFYSDEDKTNEIFRIRARRIIDIGATYDITDPSGNLIGSLKREGLSSTFIKDSWLILNVAGETIGKVEEDSSVLGLIRRYVDLVSLFIPQKFTISFGDQVVGFIRQNKNPFTVRLQCTWQPEAVNSLGNTLIYAIPSMLAIIEGRQG